MHEGAQSGPAPSMGSASGCTRGSANDVTANKRFAVVSTTSPEPHKWHSAIPARAPPVRAVRQRAAGNRNVRVWKAATAPRKQTQGVRKIGA
jgi:hypothetical protein